MSNMIPEYRGCPWPMDPACKTDEWDDEYEDDVKERALALASSSLNRLTAYRVSNCPVTVRPVSNGGSTCCYVPYGNDLGAFHPGINLAGRWVNNCGASSGCAISLPKPVGRVDEVKVDGQVIDPDDYRVASGRIVWQGEGDCPWLMNQDLSLPDTEEGTMSVTYLNAYPVDSLGAYAVGILAMEFAKACAGARECGLPPGVRQIVRAGVAMEINPGMFPDGFTGIREVDAFISLWNPRGSKQRQASTVWSPDLRPTNVSGGIS